MSHPHQKEIIPMMERTPSSSSKKKSLPVLRVDLTRPSGSTRTSVDYRYSQVSPNSPLLSADRLSVKFAPEVFDFQDIEMEKVRFNKENTVTDGEDDEEEGEAAVGEEEEEEEEDEEEDYSASVSAILLRRASSRRQTKRRRPSSAFSPDELGLPRRRSSVITTTSAETAISIEEGVTEEHIFQNIRLHKEVLSSVKQQPWPMRKKIKLVKQAKKYVKRHEGELQERLAQSKTTRDMLACCDIIFVKEWQFVKRELANFMNVMVPWELRIKEIESHFGSVVASYFTFLRWLFWVNLMISLILLTFVAIPEVFFADHKDAGERKKLLPDETANSTKLITLWDFEGVLKYSPLFYGYYNSQENSKRGYGYKGPLAYFITGIAVYIYSFVATLKRMAQNSRQSKLSEKDDECVFTWKLFTGWDYMIGNSETAHNRTASIILGFKEALLEEAEKKRDERSWKMLALRALINLCVLGLFAFSVFAVVSVVKRSANPQNENMRGWWKQNEVTIVVSLITNVFPFLFEILGSMERYHPRKRLRMQLGRIMVLNLLNLYTFIFASFSKINDKTVQLQKIKESLINMTLAASMALKSVNVTPTTAAVANMVDDSREAHTTARQMNCTRVMRCSTMTTQSTSDFSSTSISSLATLLLLTSSSIGPPSNIIDKNSTVILSNNVNNTSNTAPQFIFNPLNNSNDNQVSSKELEDNDNEIWKLLLPNLSKPSSENTSKAIKGKNASTTFETGKDLSQGSFLNHSFYPAQNKSFQQEQNWLIDKIKVVVSTQYNVTDVDENNQTRPFDYDDILDQIDYDVDKNMSIYSNNDTFGDYDLVNDTLTTSSYEDFDNQTGESSSTTDNGCYYVTVCTEWTPNAPLYSTPELPVEVNTESIDQKSLTTYSTIRTTELPTNVDLSLETHRLNITMRRVLRNLCWETVFGQELVKLTVMDLVLTIISTLMVDFIRALFVRVMNNCWCWDLEKKFPQYGDFKIAENILHLVNNQGMVWMGMFFSPGLPLINLIKLAIMMYLRSWAVLTCNVPHEVVFRASRSNNFYLALLLTMLFLCVLPVSYAIVWVEPSWHCGPFSNYQKIYYLFTNSTKNALPKELHHTLDYIASPGIVIPLLMLLILVIYYLISLTNSLREANNDLKVQLRRERTEERRKVFQMVDRKHRGDFSGDLIDNTPFHKWQKTLTILPNKTSTDSPSDTAPVTTNIAHAHAGNGDLKTDAKKLMSKLSKHAKLKTSGEEDDMSFLLDDTCIDVEPVDTSPIDVDKHRLKQTDVLVDVHSKQSPTMKIDHHHTHNQKHHDNIKKKSKEVSRSRKPADDDSKAKGGRRTDSFTKKHKREGSASSVSSEDIPEIVITHTASTDSLLDGSKPFDQSKSSSIDTVIESGECQKEPQSREKTSEKKTKKKEKSSPIHKPQRDHDIDKKEHLREQREAKEVKNKERAKEKYEDVDSHKEKNNQPKKHPKKGSHDKKKEDSSSQETENERMKQRETDSHHSHKKIHVDSSKRSPKNEKQIDDFHSDKTSVTPKCGSGPVEKLKDKKHFDRESVEKDYSTGSSVERNKKKKEQKHKRIAEEKEGHETPSSNTKHKRSKEEKELHDTSSKSTKHKRNVEDKELRETPSKNTKSSEVAKVDNDSNLDYDDVHSSKKKSDQRSSLQKSDHGSKKTHKTDREDKKKHGVSKADESGSKEKSAIEENRIEEEAHENRDIKGKYKECIRETLSSEDEPCVASKKSKKKKEEKIQHSDESSGKSRVRKDTDETASIRRCSVSTESIAFSDSRKKKVEDMDDKSQKLRKESEQDVPFSSNLKNKAQIKSTAEERSDVGKRGHGNSKEDSTQSRNESKRTARKVKDSKKSSKRFTENICREDGSNKTIASRRDSIHDDSEVEQNNCSAENKSNSPTRISLGKPRKKDIPGKTPTSEDTETNEPDSDSLVSGCSGKSSDSEDGESMSGNEKEYNSNKDIEEKNNEKDYEHDHGGKISDSKGNEQQREDIDSNSDVDESDHHSSSSEEESQ